MLRPVAVCALAFWLLGCPPARPPVTTVDGGPVDFVGRACSVDAECGALRCDPVRRQCICLSDQSCKVADVNAAPRYCNNYTGLCVTEIAGCKSDAECAATSFCDPTIRACQPLKTFCGSCNSNSECGGAGDNCVTDTTLNAKFCGRACAGDADCPRGAKCRMKDDVRQCWPDKTSTGLPATCRNFAACTPDSLASCNSAVDCADASQRCDMGKGKCVAIEQACPFGTTCDPRAKLCVAECARDQDCGDPSLRCNNKVCEPLVSCTNDKQCADNRVCTIAPGASEGTCQPFCQTNTDCPLGNLCDRQAARVACVAGCTTNSGCALDQRCNPTTKKCEGPSIGAIKICQANNACGTCQLCDGVKNECVSAQGQFPHCQPCASQGECPGGACVSMADGQTVCVRSCGQGQDCPQGFACLSLTSGGQACVPADRLCGTKCQ